MKHLFKPEVFKGILSLLVLLLIVKTIWFVAEVLWLPTKGINEVDKTSAKSLYYRVKLTPNKVAAPTVKPTKIVKKEGSIKEITLLAIYNASDLTVITVLHKGKSKVMGRGDEINGFVLEGAGNNFATFSKNNKTYKVMLVKSKTSANAIKSISPVTSSKPVSSGNGAIGKVIDLGDHKVIDRSLIDHYTKNMDDIYKEVGLTEVKNGKDLKGFRFTFVRKGSPFEKLGLRRDDVIRSINGQEINSYNAAFGMYKNIKNIDNLTLVIQRGKEEMELEYEIN